MPRTHNRPRPQKTPCKNHPHQQAVLGRPDQLCKSCAAYADQSKAQMAALKERTAG